MKTGILRWLQLQLRPASSSIENKVCMSSVSSPDNEWGHQFDEEAQEADVHCDSSSWANSQDSGASSYKLYGEPVVAGPVPTEQAGGLQAVEHGTRECDCFMEDIAMLGFAGALHRLASFSRVTHAAPSTDDAYYAKCMLGGVLSSSIRWLNTPLDRAKCNMQVNPTQFPTMWTGLQVMHRQGALYRGLIPTMLAYSCQSGGKYFLYERLKDDLSAAAGPDYAHAYRGVIYVAAAASAEAVADIFMCPWEMLKVRMQTSSGFPHRFGPALTAMWQQRAQSRFPFGSLGPLWGRQIPGTMANFFAFESTVEAIYTHLLTKPKESYNRSTQLGVTFCAGYVAGLLATVLSHPMDGLISHQGKQSNQGKSLWQIARQAGFFRLATQGLGPRIAMTGSIIGFQWFAYDTFKTAMGMGTTGGEGVKIQHQHESLSGKEN